MFCVVALFLIPQSAWPAREAVLKQIDLPHSYYYREMYLPQLTSGPSAVDFSPDGQSLVYSMAGSLWLQKIGDGTAIELTSGPGYDYQPDWSPDGRHIAFVRHDRNALELWQLDLQTRQEQQLTQTNAVNVEPRYSPDGKRLAYVSTAGSGHFNLFVAAIDTGQFGAPRPVVPARQSAIARYYYSTHDHAINPAWTPDGRRLVFVSNREIAYGSGDLCSVAVDSAEQPRCFVHEETSWRARPEVAPDGQRVLYSSYQGRQWHQLWVTTLLGDATLPLSFGDFDITQARWSPDGRRIAYISNEAGNIALWVREFAGGERQRIEAHRKQHKRTMLPVRIRVTNAQGQELAARLSVVGSDKRFYGPDDHWIHADDGFDPQRQHEEAHYFHCMKECTVTLPEGAAQITAWHGQEYAPAQQELLVESGKASTAAMVLSALVLPDWASQAVTADLTLPAGTHRVRYRAALRSLVAIDHLEIVHNGQVVAEHRFGRQRASADMEGEITLKDSGWVLLRAWNDGADPLVFDLYPYATTSPIYVDVGDKAPQSPADAAYFVKWMERVIDAAEARTDYNDAREKQETLNYLQAARRIFADKAR